MKLRFSLGAWVRRFKQRSLHLSLAVLIGVGLSFLLTAIPTAAQFPYRHLETASPLLSQRLEEAVPDRLKGDDATSASLPSPRPHPLPLSLARWQDSQKSGDYFDQVKQVDPGYLVWSQFPITVFIEPLTPEEAKYPFTTKRAQDWIKAVSLAVQEWNPYLPLQIVDQPAGADITVRRSPPPIQLHSQDPASAGSDRPSLPLGRIRSAETRFNLYVRGDTPSPTTSSSSPPPASPTPPLSPILTQRFTIQLRPDQAPTYLQAAARHELGHALGIWGHSPLQTDALYFSQVRNSPPISHRDINTLKCIYQQPTRLGWSVQ